LLADVYAYDHYIFTHSLNVTMYTLAIGMKLNLPEKDLEILGLGAILHDVGKMKIPEQILLKPDRLSQEEYEEIKKHAEEGFQILRKIPTVSLVVAHCAYQHHERLDGSGYPRGIKDKEIHFFGKIIAVADVFDAVTSNRVYRKALLPHEGLEILYSGSGTLFDQKIIEAFRQAVAVYPSGITVELNDGRKGIVSQQNVGLSDRPIIRILEEKGIEVNCPYELDLKNELDILITACDTTFKKA
jgi:putative nucleotidyltransferase with HDIG domain